MTDTQRTLKENRLQGAASLKARLRKATGDQQGLRAVGRCGASSQFGVATPRTACEEALQRPTPPRNTKASCPGSPQLLVELGREQCARACCPEGGAWAGRGQREARELRGRRTTRASRMWAGLVRGGAVVRHAQPRPLGQPASSRRRPLPGLAGLGAPRRPWGTPASRTSSPSSSASAPCPLTR